MNLIKTLIDAALVESYVDEEIKAARQAVCGTCTAHNHSDLKCNVCGCYTDIKSGMEYNKNPKKGFRVERTHCPSGFWPYKIDNIWHDNDAEIAEYYNKLDNIR